MNKYVLFGLLAIMALASFFRLWNIKSVPPGFSYDEAMYANNAVEAWETSPPAGGLKIFYPENNGREGLWINMLAPVLALFGNNEPWVSRTMAAIFGILTVLGLYFLAKTLFNSERIALLASFFLAVSFWHVNFSRIGFRAILTPFFLVWGFYFLWKVIQKKSTPAIIVAGVFFGLGFHTYISFRVAPLLLIIPFILMWKRGQKKLIFIFLLFAFIITLPIGLYFLKNPQDFFGRSSQVSVFSSASPLSVLGQNIIKTTGMFFVWGDSNWRHNFRGSPELWWPVAILFLMGIWQAVKRAAGRMKITSAYAFILLWLVVMLIPAVISSEGLPHALRSIGAIPAVMILAALGFDRLISKILNWLREKTEKYPENIRQLARLKKQLLILLFVFLLAVAGQTFNQYFLRWAGNPSVALAFNDNYVWLGKYLNTLPKSTPKYVIINEGEDGKIRDNPHPSPVIMFITHTYRDIWQAKNNLFYINPADLDSFALSLKQKEHFFITMLEFNFLIRSLLKEKIPDLKTDSSSGFIILYR